MKVNFKTKDVELYKDITEYVQKKVDKLEKFFKKESDAEVKLSSLRGRVKAEITVKSGNRIYRASQVAKNLREAVDESVDAIVRQIRKNRTRLEKHLRETLPEVQTPAEEVEEEQFRIEREKHFPIQAMTIEEAILQMNLLGHTFFAYKDVDKGEAFCIVYEREEDGYGVIVAE